MPSPQSAPAPMTRPARRPCAALLTLLTCSGLLLAPAQASPGAPAFGDWDQNKDGRVSLSEMKLAMNVQFKAVDQNKDGFATVDEVLNLLPAMVRGLARPKIQDYIRSQDANRDGRLTLIEVMNAVPARFKRIDANHDGYISQDEFDHRPMPGH